MADRRHGLVDDKGCQNEDRHLLNVHVVLFDKNTFGYPASTDGRIPVPEGGGMLDVTATFGFLAAVTSKLRLGTGVALALQLRFLVPCPFAHPN